VSATASQNACEPHPLRKGSKRSGNFSDLVAADIRSTATREGQSWRLPAGTGGVEVMPVACPSHHPELSTQHFNPNTGGSRPARCFILLMPKKQATPSFSSALPPSKIRNLPKQ
jgi:hypothetical protein